MLTVVQDQQVAPVREGRHQPLHRVERAELARPGTGDHRALPDAERVEHRVGHVTGVGHRRQLHHPHLAARPFPAGSRGLSGWLPGEQRRRFDGQPRLACPARAGQRDEPALGQHLHHPRDVLVPADEAGQRLTHRGRSRAGRRAPRCHPFRGGKIGRAAGRAGVRWWQAPRRPREVLPEHAQVDLLELGGGVNPQLAGEQFARLRVLRERLGLPPGRVEGAHQQPARAFGHRIGGDHGAQFADQGVALAQGKARFDQVQGGAGVQFFEAGGRAGREPRAGNVRQRGPAPGAEGRPQDLPGRRRITGGQRLAAVPCLGLEGHGVDQVRRERQPVARRMRFDHLVAEATLAQRGAQPGNQGLQRVARVGRRVVLPEPVDQRAAG